MRNAILSTLLLNIVLVSACAPGKKSPGEKSSSEKPATTTSSSPVPPPTAISSTAAMSPAAPTGFPHRPVVMADVKEILTDYTNNEVRADDQYKNKVVELRGQVKEIKKDATGSIYVTIGTGANLEIPVVQCFSKDGEAKAFAALDKGQIVTIVGRVEGLMMNVLVKDCVVNPDVQRCERLRAAMGGVGTCKPGPRLTGLHLPDKTHIIPLCYAYKQIFDKMVALDKDKPKNTTVNVYSPQSLCMAIVGRDKEPVPPDVIASVQKALDTLP